MKRAISAIILGIAISAAVAVGSDGKMDPNQLFYTANSNYQKQEYSKAMEEYMRILDMGLESGRLYYNIGNTFFKMGKIGYAILYYEKASKLIPQDSDLKSNLAYARSFAGAPEPAGENIITGAIAAPFKGLTLGGLAVSCAVFYILLILISIAYITRPLFAKRFTAVLLIAILLFLLSLSAFAIRYYNSQILKHGIVVNKEVECRYEPIDKSTVYYKLAEGDEVVVLDTRSGWRHIKRADGKIAWVKAEAVEEI